MPLGCHIVRRWLQKRRVEGTVVTRDWENRTVNKRDGFAVTEIHLREVKRLKP